MYDQKIKSNHFAASSAFIPVEPSAFYSVDGLTLQDRKGYIPVYGAHTAPAYVIAKGEGKDSFAVVCFCGIKKDPEITYFNLSCI